MAAQGVPAHIGTPTPGHGYEAGDPYAEFLPPAVPIVDESDMTALRAMVIVKEGTKKVGQRYVQPLLTLSGDEYKAMRFEDLYARVCDALRGDHPRLVAEKYHQDGTIQVIFSDGSSKLVGREQKGDAEP